MTLYAAWLLVGTAFCLAVAVLPLCAAAARRWGVMDKPGGRKDHGEPVPLAGGSALFVAVSIPALVAAHYAHELAVFIPEGLHPYVDGLDLRWNVLCWVLGGALINLVLGAWDDARPLSPWLRLAVQSLAAWLPVNAGLSAHVFGDPLADAILTILFMVTITNAFNFIDNMNGLATGVAFISALHLFTLAQAEGEVFDAGLLALVLGALAAVLLANFPRARVFLGDSGSTSVGFLLAALAVAHTFAHRSPGSDLPPLALAGPLLVLAVPVIDFALVFCTRLARGVHPFTAGHDHLSHRLLRHGMTRRGAVVWLWGVAILAGLPLHLGIGLPLLAAVWVPGLAILLLLVARTVTRP